MKNIRIILIAFVLSLGCSSLQAKLSFGVRGGINVSRMRLDKGVFDGDNRAGFFVGPTFDFTLPIIGLGMDASLLYDYKCAKISQEDGTVLREKIRYIDLPVNVRYVLGWDNFLALSFYTGPQMSFVIGDTWILDDNYSLDRTMLSWNVGLAVRLFKKYQVGYNFNVGIGRTGEFTGDHALVDVMGRNFTNNTHQLVLTYYF